MTCKLFIHNTDPNVDNPTIEHTMTGDLLTLGRSKTNDVPLEDPNRLVSSHHAEIRHRHHEWYVIDTGSMNGTRLNGETLEVGKEFLLHAEDEIQIGKFCIRCVPQPEIAQMDPCSGRISAPTPLPAFPSRLERTISSLVRVYQDQHELSISDRQPYLVQSLRDALQDLDAQEAEQLLSLVESHFCGSEALPYQNGKSFSSPAPFPTPPPSPSPLTSPSSSHEGIEALLNEYLESGHGSLTPEEQAELSSRLRQILEMFFEFLHKALQGRRQVEQEFEAEVTRIFSRERNPVKEATSATALGKSLFQVRHSKDRPDMTIQHLQAALDDLSLHHMGMMAGFRESLHGLLMQLDPATLEQEAQSTPLQIGPLSIPSKFVPFSGIRNWSYFKRKHHQFLDQEVKTFESILGPHFSKGYLRVHDR